MSTKGSMEVRPVIDRSTRRAFLHLPWAIYRDDPLWAPPLLLERREFINPRKHPFFRHGAAAWFVAYQGARPVGRIMVSDDPNYNRHHATNLACFGMFESLPDENIARALLDKAAAWARERGRVQLLGPIDYSTNYACGLLVDGFNTPPRVMMNHNPPYYGALLEAWGLRKAKDLLCWWFDDERDMLATWRKRAQRLAERGGITIRPLRLQELDREIALCREVYNQAWEKNWGFVGMTDAEFSYLARQLRHFADPELLLLAEVEGRAVGFSLTLPDLNEAIRPLNGRLFRWGLPLGLLKLQRNLKRVRTARLLILGVLNAYRRRGITELLILRTLDYGKNVLHYNAAELSWTLEDNDLINRACAAVGAHRYKTYRIYEKDL